MLHFYESYIIIRKLLVGTSYASLRLHACVSVHLGFRLWYTTKECVHRYMHIRDVLVLEK